MPDAVPPPGTNAPALPSSETADITGRTIGGFQVLRRLGAGGMGQVYLARQLSLKREVALKLLRSDLAANPTALKRFEAEAHAVAKLNHPNIVQVYEFNQHDGLRYMALEYVEGRNLRDHLDRRGAPELPVALSIMKQVATALQKAHEQGLVHRDIKPENILVTRKVEVKVTDFGLSRFFAGGEALNLTQSGVTLGTPLYLSPEQAQGHVVDHRSDIYSFGVTCYHLLSGEPPFRGATAVEVALKHLTDPPPPLADLRGDLPPDLCGMVHKMMAKNPDDRYQSAKDLLRDLAKVREGLSLGLAQTAGLGSTSVPPASVTVPLTLSSSSATIPAPTQASTLVLSEAIPTVRPIRWVRWLLAGATGVLAAIGGVVAYHLLHPPQPLPNPPAAAPATVGLPDLHPTEKLVTTRERELLKVLGERGTAGDKIINASIELGLLYVREGRLDEAQERFTKLEKERLDTPVANAAAHITGRLGRAIVLAYRDNDSRYPQAAQASIRLFSETVTNAQLPKKVDRTDFVRVFLLRHPDLLQAISEALTRDAVNIAPAKLPPALEALQSPRGLTKRE